MLEPKTLHGFDRRPNPSEPEMFLIWDVNECGSNASRKDRTAGRGTSIESRLTESESGMRFGKYISARRARLTSRPAGLDGNSGRACANCRPGVRDCAGRIVRRSRRFDSPRQDPWASAYA